MVRTQIQLTEEQMAGLKTMAARMNVSLAELIRRGVSLLVSEGPTATFEERRRRAIAATRRYRSGLSDVSERHDEYLDEAFSQ